MSDHQDEEAGLAAIANERYWSSDASVNQIADELGLSKSSLYGLIGQMTTGLACPDCGSELVYGNRTARDRGLMSCPACGHEGSEEGLEPVAAAGGGPSVPAQRPRLGSARTVAGAALLGLAAGILIGSAARR